MREMVDITLEAIYVCESCGLSEPGVVFADGGWYIEPEAGCFRCGGRAHRREEVDMSNKLHAALWDAVVRGATGDIDEAAIARQLCPATLDTPAGVVVSCFHKAGHAGHHSANHPSGHYDWWPKQ